MTTICRRKTTTSQKCNFQIVKEESNLMFPKRIIGKKSKDKISKSYQIMKEIYITKKEHKKILFIRRKPIKLKKTTDANKNN